MGQASLIQFILTKKTGVLMQSVTVAGGDVEQVPYARMILYLQKGTKISAVMYKGQKILLRQPESKSSLKKLVKEERVIGGDPKQEKPVPFTVLPAKVEFFCCEEMEFSGDWCYTGHDGRNYSMKNNKFRPPDSFTPGTTSTLVLVDWSNLMYRAWFVSREQPWVAFL